MKPIYFVAAPLFLIVVGAISQALDGDKKAAGKLIDQSYSAQARMEAERASVSASSDLAEFRRSSGCIAVPAGTRLIEGVSYVGTDGQPLPEGAFFCDDFGNTAIQRNGITADLARTAQ